MRVSFFIALVVDGILAGSVYALIALAFVVVYRVARIVNLALGEYVMLGGVPREIALPIPRMPLEVGALRIATDRLAAAAFAAICVALVAWFYLRSRTGVALRAIAEDRAAAMASGIDARRYVALTWVAMGVICVAAGTLWTFVSGGGFSVALVGLKVLPIVIIGGLDSIPGAFVGAMIVGVLESLAAGYHDPGFAPVAAWLVLLMVLIVRPQGLFGTARVERV